MSLPARLLSLNSELGAEELIGGSFDRRVCSDNKKVAVHVLPLQAILVLLFNPVFLFNLIRLHISGCWPITARPWFLLIESSGRVVG